MLSLFDERDEAVRALLSMAIRAAKKQGKYVGICGQGPFDHEDFAAMAHGVGWGEITGAGILIPAPLF